jgi:alanine dehydrogenase
MTSSMFLLSRREIVSLLPIGDVVEALEAAFLAQARGAVLGPVSSRLPAGEGCGGVFHAKGGGLERGGASYAAFKVNGNFPENPRCHGLPTIQGLIVLADALRGTPLAVMDSIEISALRTAAATAIAVRCLAPPSARRATIAGCGVQGWAHARALRHVLPEVELLLHDLDNGRSAELAERVRAELGGAARSALELEAAARASDIVVTCTTARAPVLRSAWISPGAFVAAVGADSPGKQELDADLVARSRVVVDDLDACAAGGELHHALSAGLMTREDVAGRLADVIAGSATVRRAEHDVVVFDSTGIALEDVAAAAVAYERALERGVGTRWRSDSA